MKPQGISHIRQYQMVCNGSKINYIDQGRGEAIVFLHHGGGFWQTWIHQINHFKENYRVLAFDWPGFGLSEDSGDELSLSFLNLIFKDFIKNSGLKSFHIVSHCIGGSVGILFRRNNMDKVLSLSVLNLCPGDRYLKGSIFPPILTYINNSSLVKKITSKILKTYFSTFYMATKRYPQLLFGTKEFSNEALYLEFEKKIQTKKQKDALIKLLFSITTYSFDEYYSDNTLVNSLIWGSNNKVTALKTDGNFFKSNINYDDFHIINNTGHISMYEKSKEFNQILELTISKHTLI